MKRAYQTKSDEYDRLSLSISQYKSSEYKLKSYEDRIRSLELEIENYKKNYN